MTNYSENKTTESTQSAQATLRPGDRPTKSKLVLLYRKLKRQGVTELQDDYKPHVDHKNATSPEHTNDDDFICFLKSDGSSSASSAGVTVVGRKIK